MTYPFYNPREADGATLEAMLVGRWPLVEVIRDDLRRQITSVGRQHWLMRGPRGIGKTHLIGVIYHQVHKEPDLNEAFLPVWLAEMEAYSVYSTAILLLEVAHQLVEELRLVGDNAGADALAGAVGEIQTEGDDPALFDELLTLLQGESKRRGKILLILMENLDAMLAGFRSRPEARRFRAMLSEEKDLLFLSTTPTRYLRQLSDPDEPLFGHLKERTLKALTEKEVGELFGRFAKNLGERELGTIGKDRMRCRVLHRLTGGNPRALVMSFSVLSGASGLRSMVEEMETLLDVQTAYFEARLARLAPRERAVVAAMALASTNLTRQEIARASRLPERSLSTQLKRLVAEGHVGQVVGEGGKGTIYELSDGLFRVWYQYRKGRKKLEPLVRFLALWYEPAELERTREELKQTATEPFSLLETGLQKKVLLQVEEAVRFARSEDGQAERALLWAESTDETSVEELNEEISRMSADSGQTEPEIWTQVFTFMLQETDLLPIDKPGLQGLLGLFQMSLGRLDEALENLIDSVRGFPDREELKLQVHLAQTLVNLGITFEKQDHLEKAEAAYRAVVNHFAEDQEFQIPVTMALLRLSLIFVKQARLAEAKAPAPNAVKKAISTYRDFITRLKASEIPADQKQTIFHLHVLTALEAAQPRRGARRGKKGPPARLREALGRVPPELRDTARQIAEAILFGNRPDDVESQASDGNS